MNGNSMLTGVLLGIIGVMTASVGLVWGMQEKETPANAPTTSLDLMAHSVLSDLVEEECNARVMGVGSVLLQFLAIQNELGEPLNLNGDLLKDLVDDSIVRKGEGSINNERLTNRAKARKKKVQKSGGKSSSDKSASNTRCRRSGELVCSKLHCTMGEVRRQFCNFISTEINVNTCGLWAVGSTREWGDIWTVVMKRNGV
ncbi:hypothetical protein B0H19DRAFT_1067722 [Mycena capillaripes]|nr:hypothetical protein B0H19DRAFT_1067722 [Mycena capillaripes]